MSIRPQRLNSSRVQVREVATRFVLGPLEASRAAWTRFAGDHPDATLYHRAEWIELLRRAYGFEMLLAVVERDGEIRAACPLARSRRPFSRRLIALPFSDSCPPLGTNSEAVHYLLDALMRRPTPGTAYEIRGIEAGAPWETVGCFVNWRLDLQRPLKDIHSRLEVNFRRNLRRAPHSVQVERGADIQYLKRFYELQLDSRRRFGLPAQPWRFFELAHALFAPANLDIWVARENGEDAATAVFLNDGGVVHYKWGARRPGCHSSANHLLFWNAIQEFASRARVLDLGRTDVRNSGLMRFKKALGAVASPLPYSFFPSAPGIVSVEAPGAMQRACSALWRRLPRSVSRLVGSAIYGYFA